MVAAGATGAATATDAALATVAVATVTGGLDTATAVGPDMARGPVMRVEPMVVERGLDMVAAAHGPAEATVAAAHGLPAATVAAERTTVVVVVTSAVVVVAVTQWVVAADMVAAVTGKLFA